ncbi:MAG: tetratricopeptide repeat protein [Burkholderiaceae bacterium]|nr:tetratricopeptide repeat protein [Burkholderiaceae bacterium]
MANHLDLEEQEQLDQLKHFWNTWGTLISAALVLVFGALAAWNGYQYWQNRQAFQAAALLEAIEVAARSGDQSRMEQAFSDIKSKYAGTIQAAQAGLLVAKTEHEQGRTDNSKSALSWVGENAVDDGYKATSLLRLVGILMEKEAYDEALKQLSVPFPAEFQAVVSDRKGDVKFLQGKKQEAIAEYERAYSGFSEGAEYRRLVEFKLNALGIKLPVTLVAGAGSTTGAVR